MNTDIVRFRTVTKRWQSVVLMQNLRFTQSAGALPLLSVADNNRPRIQSVYVPTTGKFLDFRVTLAGPIVGSSHGWLATADQKSRTISLFNPFKGDVVSLPPVPEHIDSKFFVIKVVLSADPYLSPHDYRVIVLHQCRNISFIRPKIDGDWRYVGEKIPYHPCDIIYYKDQLVAVDSFSRPLSVNDFDSDHPRVSVVVSRCSSGEPSLTHYLAESSAGELLVVRRCYGKGFYPRTTDFKIFRLLPAESRWVQVEGLGGDSMFIGVRECFNVPANRFPGIRSDHIYFADHYVDSASGAVGGVAVGSFNMEDGTAREIDARPFKTYFTKSAVWILPTMVVPLLD